MARESILAPEILVKHPSDARLFGMDFSGFAELLGGETISSATVTATPSGLTLGSPSILGSRVRAQISGGSVASGQTQTIHYVTFTATTSGGRVLCRKGRLVVTESY